MISCIILAGGKSERMGQAKGSLEIEGKSFLIRICEAARRFSDDVILSLASREQFEGMDLGIDKVAIDEFPNSGPLGGMFSALKLCSHKYTAVAPIDSPLLNADVYRYMAKKALGYDGVVPKWNDRIEPLHAVYRSNSMLQACRRTLAEGYLQVSNAVARLSRVRYIPIEDFKVFDPELLTFFNVNYPRDLKKLNEMIEREKH
jgi:molybdopterin-guanine dinucleotide biosynthesis protein A